MGRLLMKQGMSRWLPREARKSEEEKEGKARRLWWMVVVFAGSGLTMIIAPGVGMAARAMKGGEVAQSFLFYFILHVFDVVISLGLVARAGLAPAPKDGRRRRRFERKYPKAAYVPGRSLLIAYCFTIACGLALGSVSQYCTALLARDQLPTSISTLMGWSTNCWFALFQLRLLFSLGFQWGRLVEPAVALLQLTGLVAAAGLLGQGGWNSRLAGHPAVIGLFVVSLLATGVVYLYKWLKRLEKAFFQRGIGKVTAEVDKFLDAKILLVPSLFGLVGSLVGLVLLGVVRGFPRVADSGQLLGAMGLLLLGSAGGLMVMKAFIKGSPSMNGIAATAALGFSFLWNHALLGQAVQAGQVVGASITLLGALALLLYKRGKPDDPPGSPPVQAPEPS